MNIVHIERAYKQESAPCKSAKSNTENNEIIWYDRSAIFVPRVTDRIPTTQRTV